MNVARDLLVLAIQAHGQKKFSDAGTLFASALASEDAPELLQHLQTPFEIQSESSDSKVSLAEIARALSASIEEESEAEPKAEDGDDDSEAAGEGDSEEDFDEDSESESESQEGQDKSCSSTKLVSSAQSPIRIKSA